MKKCKLKDCDKFVTPKSARGYCPVHYARWQKHKDPYRVDKCGRKKIIAKCTIDKCDNLILQRGYCRKHYFKWYRHGDPEFEMLVRGNTPASISWASMKQRCGNPKDPSYQHYGGRGIKYIKRWELFDEFLKDMGERPEGTTLDRIDNDSDYTPENCRWATLKQQANNRSDNVYITYKGEKRTAQEWSEIYGLPRHNITWRLNHWNDLDKIFLTPIRPKLSNGQGARYGKK